MGESCPALGYIWPKSTVRSRFAGVGYTHLLAGGLCLSETMAICLGNQISFSVQLVALKVFAVA